MTLITATVATGAGAATLATLRDRVEQVLSDTGNATWSTAALDEAIRHALDAYTLVTPHRAIAALTLAADGREVDVSSLTSLISVLRVWWEYTASDPEHPPQWREFEQWPGSILWINDSSEPATGDVVRIWYTARHTLNGLDGAAVTTIPDAHTSLIVAGAAAHAARNYAQRIFDEVNIDGWTPKRFTDWADGKENELQQGLARIARARAAQSAGVAPSAPLDRWDQ